MTCPVCGGDPQSRRAQNFLASRVVTMAMHDPGGAELIVDGIRIRVTAMCDDCDYMAIIKALILKDDVT